MKKKIAVIGAGIVGSTIAYSLSKRDIEVHVFDQQTNTGDLTFYSIAWLNASRKTPLDNFVFYNTALHRWPWFNTELGGDLDLTWGGTIAVPTHSSGETDLKKDIEPLLKWGYAIHPVDRKKMQALEPEFDVAKIPWGAYLPDEGSVDPEKCTQRLLELAQKNGAKLHRNKKVTALVRNKNKIDGIKIGNDEIKFDQVILASGTTIAELAATAKVTVPEKSIPVIMMDTSPCKKRFKNITVLHLYSDNKILEAKQNPDDSFRISKAGTVANVSFPDPQAAAQEILDEFAEIFPPAKNLSFTPHVVHLAKPENGRSYFSFAPGVDNLYIALSHSAVVIASVIGEWVTQEIIDEIPIHWFEQFRLK